ncbi:insulinase family protein [Synechococcus sp. CS-1324]|nr:insulinase family protein [Synechococcus sp. CS-1326]MCT0230811.1 insulinase family protein [Synechococcus sp. CS-1324]MCT0233485.1 insulinase family protein [Synechococcus sp. CS-1327]PZV02418.1 MAG: insulinase family protein [Cyanobium sp.]
MVFSQDSEEIFPSPLAFQLDNGVQVVTVEQEQAPVVCLDFWCQAGSRTEAAEEYGLAHFLEHMVFKGSGQLAAGEFDRRIEALGGSSNAATGFDDVHYHVLIPPAAAPEALDLLLDLVLHPRLDPDDFGMEKQVVLEELAQSEDQPEEVAFQRLLALACPGHPYGRPILGDRRSLLDHDPQRMARFHRRRYQPGHCSLGMAGAVGDLDLEGLLASSPLAGLSPPDHQADAGLTAAGFAPLRLQSGRHDLRLPRLEAGRLLMAWSFPAAADLDAVAGADLLTTLLAEGKRSRLVQRLREDLRLVESIDLDLNVLEAGSLGLLEAVFDPGQAERVEAQISQVWQELCAAPPTEQELERARRLVANGYRFGLESASAVAGLTGHQGLWGRLAPLSHPLELLEAWSPERIRSEMVPLLDPGKACRLLVLPA